MVAITNKTGFLINRESSLGVPTTVWTRIQPNNVPNWGATISTIRRRFISTDRQGEKGTITDVESGPELELDLIHHHLLEFGEAFMFASFVGAQTAVPSAVDADSYTVPAMTTTLVLGDLIAAKGFGDAANNGVKEIDTGATSTDLLIVGAGLTVDASPNTEAIIEVCGFRGASGDLEIDTNGDLISTVKDLTTLGLVVGEYMFIGGVLIANSFATAADRGLARIVSIATNLVVLEKRTGTFTIDSGAALRIDIFFGRFLRNVPIDDGDFLERTFHIEASFTDAPAANEYSYAKGNTPNTMAINVAAQEKATMTIGFLGQDTDPPTTSQLTGADTPIEVAQPVAFNTSADVARLRIQEVDETGLTTNFTNFSLALNNNIGRETAVGTLGAIFLPIGDFDVSLEGEIHFEDKAHLEAIRNNTTVGLDFALRNDDGGLVFDYPSMTLGGGGTTLNRNETVKLALTGEAFKHDTLGFSFGITVLPFMPAAVAVA